MVENAAFRTKMRDKLIEGLGQIPHSSLNGDDQNRLPGNVNFCFEGIEGETLLLLLDDKGTSASSGSAIASSSMATELIKGKPVKEVNKMHCSVLAEEAIQSALEDYQKRVGKTFNMPIDIVGK